MHVVNRKTPFAKAVAKLKPPTAAGFQLAAWEAAFDDTIATEDDRRLLATARWMKSEIVALGARDLDADVRRLRPDWSTIVAIAALNREFRTAAELAAERQREAMERGVLAVDTLANVKVPGPGAQEYTLGGLAELAIDATENWLFDAALSAGTEGAGIENFAPTDIMAVTFYSYRKSLNSLWGHAWHDGWFVEPAGADSFRWMPANPEQERLELAWRSRQEANLMNLPNIDQSVWPKMPPAKRRTHRRRRGVLELRDDRSGVRFKVGTPACLSKTMPAFVFESGALEGSYVSDFLDADFPLQPGVNVLRLLQAWHAILDIATLLSARTPLPTTVNGGQAKALALAVSKDRLTQTMADVLKVDTFIGAAVVEFLTFSFQTGGTHKAKGNKGLWAAPLVAVPGSDDLLIGLPVLTMSHPARRVDAWLEKGGINDDSATARGDSYEALYRASVVKAVAKNKIFTSARASANEIAKTKDFPEQVDLVVAFGGLCLVCEVKFFLMPADPHERDRYWAKLRSASEQAKRKAAALASHRDVLAAALGITETEAASLRLIPFVVTNQGFGFSQRVDGVLVVEAGYLRTHLGAAEIVTGMVMDVRGRMPRMQTHSLYTSEADAAARFETEMANPFVLKRFFDRTKWAVTPVPSLAHGVTVLAVPHLEDYSEMERWQAEAMIASMKG